ncbi:MAG: hypothetical protein FWB85_00985 [Chitinispirillia bacterium]|nr:hypothetical protein [Chitinispirillia bacterium]
MFDINKELNDIILKYNIDRQYSRFRVSLKAIELLNRLVAEHEDILFIGSNDTDLMRVRQDIVSDREFEYLKVKVNDKAAFDSIDGSKAVIIASYSYKYEISSLLTVKNIKHIDLYDYFMLNGLSIEHDYYNIFGDKYRLIADVEALFFDFYNPYNDIIHNKMKLIGTSEISLKKIYMEKLIFKLLYIRDFVTVKQYIDEYLLLYSADIIDYCGAWHEISALLDKIREIMGSRKERDIIMFWVDAIEYGRDGHMPFLKSVFADALTFENAFTVTPYTIPTLKTILMGAKVIDDTSFKHIITEENSPLITSLRSDNITFTYYGIAKELVGLCIQSKFNCNQRTPSTMKYWNAVNDMLNSGTTGFYILHAFVETHPPCISADLDYNYDDFHISSKYLDKQLEFYSNFLSEKSVKVYMSDHGVTPLWRFHTILKVRGPNIPKISEERLFSYIDFHKFIDYVISPDDSKYNALFREYIEIQDVDFYNGYYIVKHFYAHAVSNIHTKIGYRGIITGNDIYIYNKCGMEQYCKIRNDGIPFTAERLEYLRGLVGRDWVDIEKEERFKYTRYLYKTLEKYNARVGDYEERKTAALKSLFTDLGDNVNVAIRIGGTANLTLLQLVGPDAFKNVKYIIDINPDCVAGKMGIPVIDPSRMGEYPIDVIITSNYQNKIPTPELDLVACKKIDVYDYLEEHGVRCTREFWYYEFERSDFDVGFPYWEVLSDAVGDFLGVKL